MATGTVVTDALQGALDEVKGYIRSNLKSGSLTDGDMINVKMLLPDHSDVHLDSVVNHLRSYKGMILDYGTTSPIIPVGTMYTVTHGTGLYMLIVHLHPPGDA